MKTTTALIAEDEPLLAAGLQAELHRQWPDLEIVSTVGDGQSAVDRTLELRPDVVFLDIRMPGLSGLDAAEALAEDWPENAGPLPLFVFVTAYDEYALRAFDHAAIDYVLKPVVPERLARTCARLREMLSARNSASGIAREGSAATDALNAGDGAQNPAERASGASNIDQDADDIPRADAPLQSTSMPPAVLDEMALRLRDLLVGGGGITNAGQGTRAPEPLRVIQAAAGNTIAMIPVDEVIYFEAADKYVRVITAEREHLIRLSLRDLREQLDPARFWQIHRGTIVRADAVAMAVRDDTGKLSITLRGQSDRLVVSRLYADRFKAM